MSSAAALARAAAGRTGLALASLVGVVLLTHLMMRAAPGTAADLVANSPELRDRLASAWGLDRPLHTAVLATLRGELGESLVLRPGTPVRTVLAERGPASLRLLLAALGLGPPLATLLALRRHRRLGVGALPAFLLAFLAITGLNELAFAGIQRGLIERPAWFSLPDTASILRDALAVGVLVVGGGRLGAAVDSLQARRAALERSPALDALRARGLPTRPALVAGLLPVVVALPGRGVAASLGALVVVEKVFLLPGAGATFWDAVVQRDLPLALGLAVAGGAVAVALRWLSELAVLWAAPAQRVAR